MPIKKFRSIPALLVQLLLAGSLALTATVSSAEEFKTKDLAVVQRPMANLKPPRPSSLNLSAWVDHEDNTYAIGENVVLSVTSKRDAYLTIVDVGTSGRTIIIFPNQYQTDNFIRAGETIQIPSRSADFDFQVSGPVGTELIKVIGTLDREPLFDANETEPVGPFKAVKGRAPGIAKDLNVVLRQPRHREWASYNKIIRIVRR